MEPQDGAAGDIPPVNCGGFAIFKDAWEVLRGKLQPMVAEIPVRDIRGLKGTISTPLWELQRLWSSAYLVEGLKMMVTSVPSGSLRAI